MNTPYSRKLDPSHGIVCRLPAAQRVAFSRDDGATWEHDWVIRDDGPESDLGYPSTVELGDCSLFTVHYQKPAAGKKRSLLWSHWKMPVSLGGVR